ncbi:MAG: hypothetical protein V1702_01890 [Candidatus Woesearchaeota archaeon]
MTRRGTRYRHNYYVVHFTLTGEGKSQKKLLRVPKGCKFLYNARYGADNKPSAINGHRVVSWVLIHSGETVDNFAPIIRLKREEGFFDRLLRNFFG